MALCNSIAAARAARNWFCCKELFTDIQGGGSTSGGGGAGAVSMIMEGRKENSQVIPPEAAAWLVCGPAGQPTRPPTNRDAVWGPHSPQIVRLSGSHQSNFRDQKDITRKFDHRGLAHERASPAPQQFFWIYVELEVQICVASCYRTRDRTALSGHIKCTILCTISWLLAVRRARYTTLSQRDMPESTKLIRGAYCAHIILSRQAVHHPWVMVRLLPPSLRPQQE